jgi:hypothetical protein
MDELMRGLMGSIALEEAERQLANQQVQTAEVANRVAEIGAHFMDQVEALTVRADKQRRLDAKRKADQERHAQEDAARKEAAQLRDYLETHPEPGASTDATHHPTGDLHAVDPVEHQDLEESDAEGDLPTELQKGAPPLSGNYVEPDPGDLGGPKDPKQVPQPVAVSLW